LCSAELEELKKQLTNFLPKDFIIRELFSSYVALFLFARKANCGILVCIDYRKLDKYARKFKFRVLQADMLLDTLSSAVVYSALDLALGYPSYK
jgi:hypothetical protein